MRFCGSVHKRTPARVKANTGAFSFLLLSAFVLDMLFSLAI